MLLANFFTNAFLIGGGGCSSIGFHHHHAHHVRMDNNNCIVSQLISSSTITLPISTTTTALSLSSKRNDNNNESSILKTAFGALQEKDQYDAVLTGLCSKIIDGDYGTDLPDDDIDDEIDIDDGTTSTSQQQQQQQQQQIKKVIEYRKQLSSTELAFDIVKDPIQLINEMSERNIKAAPRGLVSYLDATSSMQNPQLLSSVLSTIRRNRSLNFYGSLQTQIESLPPNPSSPVRKSKAPVGQTRAQRLTILPSIPIDNRAQEVTTGILTLSTVVLCLISKSLNGVGFLGDETTMISNSILTLIVIVGVLDNFYDVLSFTGSTLVSMNKDKLPKFISDNMIKSKVSSASGKKTNNLPFQLGTGLITQTIVQGLGRLFNVDTERDCQCEAAAFIAAYGLGLPVFAFRPNSLEAAVLVLESIRGKEDDEQELEEVDTQSSSNGSRGSNQKYPLTIKPKPLDPLISDDGIMKILVWLMAPVAYESSLHPQLFSSDPNEARGFLKRLEEKKGSIADIDRRRDLENILQSSQSLLNNKNGNENIGNDDDSNDEGGNVNRNNDEIEDLLQWAYAEADSLLRDKNNRIMVEELTERLVSGAATVGDCVALLEDW